MPRTTNAVPTRGLNLRSGGKTKQSRSALGEITNATNDGKHKSLRSQVKKGLGSIVGRNSTKSSSTTTSTSSVKRPKKSPFKRSKHHKVTDSSIEETTGSLPSSQEEGSLRALKLKHGSIIPSLVSDDEEEYVSANEEPEEEECEKRDLPTFRYQPPARVLPPKGVIDFDLQSSDDLTACPTYAADIFQYYKQREAQFSIECYIANQPDISEIMRAILVDWLVEVQESFELNHETLYTAVKMLDMYMSRRTVSKEQLQLVGAVACLIACKIDERIPPNLDDFVYVCDDAYTRKDIVRKEMEMIDVVGYDVCYPLSYRFLRRFGRVCDVNMPNLTLARYILEVSLMEYNLNVETSESLLAAAALVLALKIKNIEGWLAAFQFYTGYCLADVEALVQKLLRMMQKPPNDHLKTIRLKYSHRVFFEVAKIAIPQSVDL